MSSSSPTDQQSEEAGLVIPNKPRRFWRALLALLLMLICALCAALYYWTWTDQGSRQLLSWVAGQQKLIKYQYVGGNLRDGVILQQIRVHTKAVDIVVDRGVVQIGWRAVVQRELHFRRASLQKFQIIKNTPPSNKPF
jgi:translocation and assembly module TamB